MLEPKALSAPASRLRVAGRPNLEAWAEQTISEGVISEWEFRENLPRIERLGRTYGLTRLRELFVNMTTAGVPFSQVLTLLERGDVPLEMMPPDTFRP